MKYAIVDIETTGSYALGSRITEIAIRVTDGSQVLATFDALVNPESHIPAYIQSLTGITDDMVSGVPSFHTIAPSVYALLQDCVFIAHNVGFDYSFVKHELEKSGLSFDAKKMCTVRLSRKILAGLPSYSLGKLCLNLGITHNDRHRAGGDADATLKLFFLLIARDQEGLIRNSLKTRASEMNLPINIAYEDVLHLPQSAGIYYFHDKKGKIIYIGKAKNIQKRVKGHFSGNSTASKRQHFIKEIHSFSFEECGTELIAQIRESEEIKRHWPLHNQSQKTKESAYALYDFMDQNGFLRLAIKKLDPFVKPLATFSQIGDGTSFLAQIVKDHALCPILCFLKKDDSPCTPYFERPCGEKCERRVSADIYNMAVEQAIKRITEMPTFLITDKGRSKHEQSFVLIEKGRVLGIGFLPSYLSITSPQQVKDYLNPVKENLFIKNLAFNYAAKNSAQIIPLATD